ncbi:MAG: aminoacyl-histidine dipeptidase [Acidobacteria bacterium]|nr:aminoacyl-histidine dipeptidase [Acidobacteriota bacterium]
MSKLFSGLEPAALWSHFEDLCDIPRPSKLEGRAIEHVRNFGERLGLFTQVDDVGNVLIRKPATPGMEDRQGVILQGHLDMVPQKNADTDHDFETDPIQAYVDGDWVTARGTTLGADNGIGVAAAMAVLEADNLPHGPVEALFTIDEETGMTGAFGLQPGWLEGDILLNMDSEDEGELYIGCAGGMNTNARLAYDQVQVPAGTVAFRVSVTGLKGGHSGLDINLGRGNSIKIMNRFLWQASEDYGLRLATLDAGSLRNAIPREAFARVVLPAAKVDAFTSFVTEFAATVRRELSVTEPDLRIQAEPGDVPAAVMDEATQQQLLRALSGCPHGVLGICADMPEVVETSTNLAIATADNGIIELATLQRSSVDSLIEEAGRSVRAVFELAGAEVEHTGKYPGWKPNLQSPILNTMKQVYHDHFGKEPEVKVIHAGLECGLLGGVYPNLDMISFGPTIRHPHSPDEKVNIDTVRKFWEFLVATLAGVPRK